MSIAEWYAVLRATHITCAALSIAGFLLRGTWMLRGSPLLRARATRILPHIVDTLLLASAIGLLFLINQAPFANHWLTAKVVLLLVYIGLGTVALKRGRTRRVRVVAFAGAVAVFAWIVGIALNRQPLAWFA